MFVSTYGPDWTQGVVSDHVHRALEAGWTQRVTAGGRHVVVSPDGYPEPVLCSEIVRIDTEDGPTDGRCGCQVDGAGIACEGHAAMVAEWMAQGEAETLAWERSLDAA
jgi:hypothetical protein